MVEYCSSCAFCNPVFKRNSELLSLADAFKKNLSPKGLPSEDKNSAFLRCIELGTRNIHHV